MKSKDELELPQIRFPIRGVETQAELADEHDEIEKLRKIVASSFGTIANATGLSDNEVLQAIEETHVDMLKDVLKDGPQVNGLKKGIQEAIKTISLATALDTAQISDVFSAKKDSNVDDLAERLYKSCQANRAKFGVGVGNMRSR
jgi:phosphoenolpyruvate-protein kinase (PTS system EI component)